MSNIQKWVKKKNNNQHAIVQNVLEIISSKLR